MGTSSSSPEDESSGSLVSGAIDHHLRNLPYDTNHITPPRRLSNTLTEPPLPISTPNMEHHRTLSGGFPGNRLSPIQSYETTKGQAARVTSWKLVDEFEELYESTEDSKENAAVSLSTPTLDSSPTTFIKPLDNVSRRSAPSHDDPFMKRQIRSDPQPARATKRRLVATAQAIEIATRVEPDRAVRELPRRHEDVTNKVQEVAPVLASAQIDIGLFIPIDRLSSPDFTASTPKIRSIEEPVPDFDRMLQEFEDEGYKSFTLSPNGVTGGLPEDDNQEEALVKALATLQRTHTTLPTPLAVEEAGQPTLNEDKFEDARQRMAQEQEEGAQRSKLLRERALERKRLGGVSSDDPSATSALRGSVLSIENEKRARDQFPLDDSSGNEATDIEELYNMARTHVSEHNGRKASYAHRSTSIGTTYGGRRPNPASRAAAERFRTQDRHLSAGSIADRKPAVHDSLYEQEQRLRDAKSGKTNLPILRASTLKSQASGDELDYSTAQPITPTVSDASLVSSPPLAWQGPRDDVKGLPVSQAGPPRLSGLETLAQKKGVLDFWSNDGHRGAAKAAVVPPLELGQEATELSSKHGLFGRNEHTVEIPETSHSTNGQQRNEDIAKSRTTKSSLAQTDSNTTAIRNRTSLTLPKNYEQFPEAAKSVIVEHEILKERKRDLEVIERVTQSIAQLRCLGCFTSQDEKELAEVRRFIVLTVKKGKYGKMERKRIHEIRKKMDARAKGYENPEEEDKEKWLFAIFDEGDLNIVKTELQKVEIDAARVGRIRSTLTILRHRARHRSHSKKRVACTLPPEGEEYEEQISRPSLTTPKVRNGNATENRRMAQPVSEVKQIEMIREKLRRFEANPAVDDCDESKIEAACKSWPQDIQDNNSDSSEEEDGIEYYLGPGMAIPRDRQDIVQDMAGPKRPKDNTQEKSDPIPSAALPEQSVFRPDCKSAQRFDLELVKQMQQRNAEDIDSTTKPAESDEECLADSDDSNTEADTDDDDLDGIEPLQVFKYTVFGKYFGIPGYRDCEEYRFSSTYQREKANTLVGKLTQDIQRRFFPNDESDLWFLRTWHEYGQVEQHLQLGKSGQVEAHFFIQKELVDLNRKAYRTAKARNIVVKTEHFVVEWERTVTSLAEEVENEDEDSEAIATDTYETIPNSDIQAFTTCAAANRCASQIYLSWHYRFLPGIANAHYQRLERDSTEQQLERLGDWGLWSRTESFERDADPDVQKDRDEQSEEMEAGADGAEEGARKKKRKVEERFKVWVRRVAVHGPGN